MIDLIIIGVFLVISLAIGLYYSKGITTFKDYAVGSSNMSTLVITISLIATTYDGGILNSRLDGYYRRGLYMLIMDLASPVSFYLASRFIILRMSGFIGDLSIAESMGKLYGTTIRIITAVMGIIMTIAILAVQFKVGLLAMTSLFCISKQYIAYYTIALALLVIIYTTLGGARSVSITDVYQFCLFSICFPIIIFTLLYHSKDLLVNWQKFMTIPQFNLLKVCTWNDALVGVLTNFIWHSVFPFDPARIQRVYMTYVQQAAKVFFKSAMIRGLFPLLFFSIAVALYMGGHKISSHQSVLDYIIHLQYFPGMKGILITAIIALLMSTADSNLHAASVLFTNDIYPIVSRCNAISSKLSLKVAQIASGTIGILAIFIVFHTTSVIQLMNKAVHFYVPAITIPMIMACFGFRARPATVILTMGISIVLAAYRIFIKGQLVGQKDIFNSLLCSTFILIITHYLLPKKPNTGWVGIPDDSPVKLQNQETKRWWLRKLYYFQSIFTASYWKDIFPKNATTFIASGIYFIIYSFILLFYVKQAYLFSYIYWYIAVMAIGTIVTMYPTFHAYKQYGNGLLHGLWPMLLCVVFFISGITYMKLSHFEPMSCALFIVNKGLSSLLLPYTITIIMLSVVLLIYKWIPPHLDLVSCKEWITTETMIGLTILLSCLVYRYLRNKANRQLQTIALTRICDQQYALASLHNQENWYRLDPTYSGKVLQDIADELGTYAKNLAIEKHQKQLYVFRQSLLKRAKEEHTYTLDSKSIHKVDIEKLILKSYETVRKLDIPIQLLLTKKTKEKYLLTDPTIFERLLTINFLNLCQSKYTIDHTVYLTISDTLLSYSFPEPNQISIHSTCEKQLSAPILSALAFSISTDTDKPNIAPTYVITDKINSCFVPKTINNLYQEESRKIAQAHGGYIETTATETGLTCCYILPIDGKKVMQFKRYHTDDLSNKLAETDASLAQETELIRLLVRKTTLTEQKVKETIHFIKQAHGNVIRKSGDPYYTHPMGVAKIVLDSTNDSNTILAALLHDVVEDTMVTLEHIELLYGMEVSYIVDMVTHYNTYGLRWKLDKSDNQSILNQCKDIRVVQIKLADRLHNLRTIAVRKLADQKRIAKDTIEFYIPWSKKNNVLTWLPEMENICNQILHANPS